MIISKFIESYYSQMNSRPGFNTEPDPKKPQVDSNEPNLQFILKSFRTKQHILLLMDIIAPSLSFEYEMFSSSKGTTSYDKTPTSAMGSFISVYHKALEIYKSLLFFLSEKKTFSLDFQPKDMTEVTSFCALFWFLQFFRKTFNWL